MPFLWFHIGVQSEKPSFACFRPRVKQVWSEWQISLLAVAAISCTDQEFMDTDTLDKEDCNKLWAMMSWYGGQIGNNEEGGTHLVCGGWSNTKEGTGLIIVIPDWVVESIKKGQKLNELDYHPSLFFELEEKRVLQCDAVCSNNNQTEYYEDVPLDVTKDQSLIDKKGDSYEDDLDDTKEWKIHKSCASGVDRIMNPRIPGEDNIEGTSNDKDNSIVIKIKINDEDIGCHPHLDDRMGGNRMNQLRLLVSGRSESLPRKVVALGECGLDYSKKNTIDKDLQKKVFTDQLKIALQFKLPLVLHICSARLDTDEVELLKVVNPKLEQVQNTTAPWSDCDSIDGKYGEIDRLLIEIKEGVKGTSKEILAGVMETYNDTDSKSDVPQLDNIGYQFRDSVPNATVDGNFDNHTLESNKPLSKKDSRDSDEQVFCIDEPEENGDFAEESFSESDSNSEDDYWVAEKDVRNKGEPDTDMGVSDNSFTVVKDLVSEQSPGSGYLNVCITNPDDENEEENIGRKTGCITEEE